MYGDRLRQLFPDLEPSVDDLFLLEAHQVEGLASRAAPADLAALLHAHPAVRTYLETRHPPIGSHLDALQAAHRPLGGRALAVAQERLLWEIADEIVYQRAPEAYDAFAGRDWDDRWVTEVADLEGATVIDAGAGTGVVAFGVLHLARVVFAVEPVARLRAYMRQKAAGSRAADLYVLDGTLDAIPLPPSTANVLITNRAVGWRLAAEIAEVERVVRDDGVAVHLTGMASPARDGDALHVALTAAGYVADAYRAGPATLRRYVRRFGDG
jgi:SAM-dependent methyltransferase